ncbi:MAG: hypothetical protein HQL76_02590 [Magnetococcales bacterium]|nr:hypothetical protein [Magnetococcales bacterium]
MAAISLRSNRPTATVWEDSRRTERGGKPSSRSSGIGTLWVVVNMALAAGITFGITYQMQNRKMDQILQGRTDSQKKLIEATHASEEFKHRLTQTDSILETLKKKEAGTGMIINNLIHSKKELASQMTAKEKEWREEKELLLNRIKALETTNARFLARLASSDQSAIRAPVDAVKESPAMERNTEKWYLDQARNVERSKDRSGCLDGDCVLGKGTWLFDNGDVYIGSWNNSLKEGQGLYLYAHGAYYFGGWSLDLKHGRGSYQYANGHRFEGEWQDGQRHGKGKELLTNGKTVRGVWTKGRKDS